MWGIDRLTKRVQQMAAQLDAVQTELSRLPGKARFDALERILTQMPTRADLDAAKAQLQQGITDASTRVATDIQALRDQLAAGNPITDQDLADIQADVQAVANIDAAAPSPGPGPSP